MATIVLQSVGSIVGGMVAGPLGAMAGRVLGGLAGAAIDNALLGGSHDKVVEGPRLKEIDGLTSTEGAPIPRVYGRARIGGQLIWSTRLLEEANTKTDRAGDQGGKSIGGGQKTKTTTYSYYANLAVGLCEGRISFIRRVWADGREIDLSTVVMRVHRGEESQAADPLIVAKEGAADAPAYRGLAYVVFERLSLAEYGNRVPQFSFEVVRAVDGLNRMVRAVCLIPGATEFGYDTNAVSQTLSLGATRPENRHQWQRPVDIHASLDALQALCPNLQRVSLVVSWFGDDLRAGQCRIEPRVDIRTKQTEGALWSVDGLDRESAKVVSTSQGAPAYGGTPSDDSVVRLIRELKQRGSRGGAISVRDDGCGGREYTSRSLGPDGAWEIIAVAKAELIGERTYRLSRLIRGLGATEPQGARAVPPGAFIVKLDEGVVPLTSDLRDLGLTWRYRVGPAAHDHGDPAFVEFGATATRDALRPLSPVHLQARRGGEGFEVSWLRRTRFDGDAWETVDVPLGESTERYEIEILKAGTVIRTLHAMEPSVRYTSAQEAADFGALQTHLQVRLAQMSAVAGRGFDTTALLTIA